ncbi:MAG: manganese efflux pump [Clostridia bacterium]|nr:manganese efflux pump [Clostridia bacterium]
MFYTYFLLPFCVSIDSFGIGVTYGLNSTKISFWAKLILFAFSSIVTFLSMFIGNFLSVFLPDFIRNFIGCFILCFMGLVIIFGALKKNTEFCDLDNSNNIDSKEAFFLALALSFDSIGISIGSSIIGLNIFVFPFLVAFFQLLFLTFGIFLGSRFRKVCNIPDSVWNIIAGFVLFSMGIFRIL